MIFKQVEATLLLEQFEMLKLILDGEVKKYEHVTDKNLIMKSLLLVDIMEQLVLGSKETHGKALRRIK